MTLKQQQYRWLQTLVNIGLSFKLVARLIIFTPAYPEKEIDQIVSCTPGSSRHLHMRKKSPWFKA